MSEDRISFGATSGTSDAIFTPKTWVKNDNYCGSLGQLSSERKYPCRWRSNVNLKHLERFYLAKFSNSMVIFPSNRWKYYLFVVVCSIKNVPVKIQRLKG